jgi:plastocyanin
MKKYKINRQTGRFLICFSAFLLFAFCSASVAQSQSKPKATAKRTVVVNIKNYEFSPAALMVNVGDTIIWKNGDVTPHTATGKGFNSGSIEAGGSWSFTAKKKGSFAYICTFHPTMKGKIIVK